VSLGNKIPNFQGIFGSIMFKDICVQLMVQIFTQRNIADLQSMGRVP
jgi:hypothetical protein